MMDWFSWLSKTGLEPSLVYEYGLAFAHNELEEEDIAYFNHEFLQSMGISIAKHRLEILKLARRDKSSSSSYALKHPVTKLLLVLKKTKKSLVNYIATLVHRDQHDTRSLIVVPNKMRKKKAKVSAISYSSRWKKSMMMRNSKKMVSVGGNQEMLMLTNGDDYYGDDSLVVSTPRLDSFSSPLMYDLHQNKEDKLPPDNQDDEEDDQHWSPALEEIRWDAMFQDLKPT